MSKRYMSSHPLKVIFEDEHYMAFFKPAGLLTVPAREGRERTFEDMANEQFQLRGQATEGLRLHVCHRLDRDTSGIIMVAKGKKNQQAFFDLFHQKKVAKKYIAFVHGRLARPRGSIRVPVKDTYADKYAPDAQGKDALTHYRLLEQRKTFAVVEAVPVTGRTNQLRIHFKSIGHPIVGENKYIFRRDFDLKFKRTALHSAEISFPHPVTGALTTLAAPLAHDMQNFLLRNP
jgi:23S rRNA pseudouridine1911/1915/1917 synthase